ncbi:reverse transcriptase domain-containing protein [Tanacetum coccineum]
MTKLLSKDTPFVFCSECIQAFNLLKEKLVNAPIMVTPNWNLPFELMCDASDYAVGAVLGQQREKKFQPIYYASKTLNEAQQNYTTTEKELLAVVFSFDKFRSYLVLSNTIVFTDHAALSGDENVAADHLSRLENPHVEKLNESDINDRFPFESLMYAYGNDEYPWFADIAIYLAGGTLLKGMSYQQKNKFFADINGPTGGHNTAANITRKVFEVVAVDYVSKWVEAQALPTNDARVVVKFLKRLFSRFGSPKALISDRGTHFCNSQLEKALQRYGVTHRFATPYHPQMSGQVEVTNQGIKRILKKTIENNKKEWSEKLDDVLWAFRIAYKTPIGTTPFWLKLFPGKLRSRWSGPFQIKQVFPYGAVELEDPSGGSFKVSGHRVKHYLENPLDKDGEEILDLHLKDN